MPLCPHSFTAAVPGLPELTGTQVNKTLEAESDWSLT
jgi:hypothetical protein